MEGAGSNGASSQGPMPDGAAHTVHLPLSQLRALPPGA